MHNSLKIIFDNKEYYINTESLDDPQIKKVFLYDDPDLEVLSYNSFGMPRLVEKNKIETHINESGAGYAVYGGGRTFGNPSKGSKFFGRGFGFGQSSSNNGGPNLMYSYDIKPLNHTLEQPPTPQANKRYIHNGSQVKGEVLGTGKKVSGIVISVKENAERDVLYYLVQDVNGIKHKINPTAIRLIDREDGSMISLKDIIGENFFPSLKDFLNENEE